MTIRGILRPGRMIFGLIALFATTAAQADTVTFAQFQQQTSTNSFSYSGTGVAGQSGGLTKFVSSTTGGNAAVGIGVNFAYVPGTVFTTGLAPALLGNQAATLTFDAQSTQAVVSFGGFAIQQQMYGVMEFRRNTPVMGKDLLLRVEFGRSNDPNAGGRYQGALQGQTSSLFADETLGEYVRFSSDFIDFSQAVGSNIALSFSSVTPRLLINNVSKFFRDHTASGTGTFAADLNVVPEPGTIACALTGLAFAGIAVIRRRRHARV